MKPVSDLKKEGFINLSRGQAMTPPVTSTTDRMFSEHGPALQFAANADGDIMRAYESMKNYSIQFGEDYTMEIMEDVIRLSAAFKGKRTEQSIAALAAAGPLPGEAYCNTSRGNAEATAIKEVQPNDN